MGAGLVGLGVSWFEMSGRANWHDQIPWLVAAIAALAASGLGTVGWLLAGIRKVHCTAFEVMSQVRVQHLGIIDDLATPTGEFDQELVPGADSGAPVVYVTGVGMTRVHVTDCPLVAGKAVAQVSADELAARGLQHCGVCCG